MKPVMKTFRQLRFTSKMLVLFGIILMIPSLIVVAYPQEAKYIPAFLIPCILTVLIAVFLDVQKKFSKKKKEKSKQHDVVVVVAVWIFAFIMGGVPFFISGLMDPLHSLFESVSGWTATGFTVLVSVEETPHIFLFYRSFMQFIGGVGFVLLILLFATGSDAMKLFSAEGHPDKLEPNLIGTARYTMLIYMGFTAAGVILYIIAGMNWFEAICHSMSALGTGGFSPKAEGIAYYNSLPIEIITIVLMLIGSTNFGVLALLLKGKFSKLKKIGELRFFFIILGIFVLIIALSGVGYVYSSFGHSLRNAAFEAVSAVTTTGYTISNINDWRPVMMFIMLLLMLIGGGAGSTAGGIKYSRIYMLFKSFIASIRLKFMPERSVYEPSVYKPQGKLYITDKISLQTHHFCLVYIVTFIAGSLLLTFADIPIGEAMYEFSSALGGVGLTTGITAAGASSYVLIIQIIGMILGRLEVYIVYVFIAAGVKKFLGLFGRS